MFESLVFNPFQTFHLKIFAPHSFWPSFLALPSPAFGADWKGSRYHLIWFRVHLQLWVFWGFFFFWLYFHSCFIYALLLLLTFVFLWCILSVFRIVFISLSWNPKNLLHLPLLCFKVDSEQEKVQTCIQAYLGDIAGLFPDYHNESKYCSSQLHAFFWFPSACESYVYITFGLLNVQSIVSKKTTYIF